MAIADIALAPNVIISLACKTSLTLVLCGRSCTFSLSMSEAALHCAVGPHYHRRCTGLSMLCCSTQQSSALISTCMQDLWDQCCTQWHSAFAACRSSKIIPVHNSTQFLPACRSSNSSTVYSSIQLLLACRSSENIAVDCSTQLLLACSGLKSSSSQLRLRLRTSRRCRWTMSSSRA